MLDNFWAQVVLSPNQHPLDGRIEIVKDASLSMASLKTLRDSAARDGYYGSDRIFQAVLKLFYELCCLKQIPVPKRGFKIYCKTTIPRQVGLAGSSALATALLKCLVQYCNIPESQFPKHEQANLALSAERDELGISAGHQDRVVQIYGGLVYMDFNRTLMKGRGYGDYQRFVGSDLLLSRFGLWLAYERQGKESGKVHRNIKALFDAGDERIVTGMADLAALADQAKRILECCDLNDALNDTLNEKRLKLARLMDRNFGINLDINHSYFPSSFFI
jgi:glucuronokinase